LKEVT